MTVLRLGPPPRTTRYAVAITRASRAACLASLAVTLRGAADLQAQPHSTPAGKAPRASVVVIDAQQRVTRAFPHDKHVKLFPTCVGCHADVAAGTAAALFPPEQSCGACHNGTDAKRVEWRAPQRPAPQRLLAFSHRSHFAETDSAGRQCASCHATAPGGAYMAVDAARPEGCFGCHTHRASSHYAPDNRCTTCHVALARAPGLTAAEVAALPRPPSHEARTFIVDHAPAGEGAVAQCATCHARESCARCHVNAATQRDILTLASDARVAAAVRGKSPVYPVPSDHRLAGFDVEHGRAAAANDATCANCHARSSCSACHTGPAARDVISRLPDPTSGALGVRLVNPVRLGRPLAQRVSGVPQGQAALLADTGARRVRAHLQGFLETHRFNAAAGTTTCEGCHTQRFCTDCHAGETRRAFHPANFAAAHAADVYARDRDCASCHNTEVFCRDCHNATGVASRGGRAGIWHNAQPQWLLQHGRAARQELTTCTTCHRESSCLRCHATSGWGVSPHGANFDASRLGRKAMAMCARCHITDPRKR